MGRSQREKGKRGERMAAAELAEVLGVAARRGVQYQGGPDSPDVQIDAPIHVECKFTERLSLWPAIEQATADARPGTTPIVWHKASRRDSVVIVRTADLYALATAVVNARAGTSG